MKRLLILPFLLMLAMVVQCGSGGGGNGGSGSGSTPVTISLGDVQTGPGSTAQLSSGVLVNEPAAVSGQASVTAARALTLCKFTITGPGMDDIVKLVDVAGRTTIIETFNVPSGVNRYFLIEFIDNEDNTLFRADRRGVNLEGEPVEIRMSVEPTEAYLEPPVFPGLDSVSNIENKSVRLNWMPATDNITPQERIQYVIYMSESSIAGAPDQNSAFGSLYTLGNATILENDPLMTFSFTNNVLTMISYDYEGVTPGNNTISGTLTPGIPYYFIVKAKDEFGRFDDNFAEMLVLVYDLTVSAIGNGTVTSSPPGIDCGTDCSEDYLSSTEVSLTATPDAGYDFIGWSLEGCSGTGSCTVLMDMDQSVEAEFCVLNTYYRDSDEDSYGDRNNVTQACSQPVGYVVDNTDCDDTNAAINPGASEIPYDGIDQDCSGADLTDVDGDGYISTSVSGGTDCNDNNAAVNPGAAEICGNEIDDNCNGQFDEGFDLDGDQYTTCGGDCNDGNAAVNPGAEEVCDGIDNNCDSRIDEGFDVDGDGYTTCGGDCNDDVPEINPGATEVCDGIDNNCDSRIDEGFDADGDGYTTCGGDCDDTNGTVYPDAPELCDGLDNNCNESIDETYKLGVDCAVGVGECRRTGITVCNATQNGEVCNVTAGTPTTETCDGLDNDCDGSVDEPVTIVIGDNDGYGYGIADNQNLPQAPTNDQFCLGASSICSTYTNQTECNADTVNSCGWITWIFDNRSPSESGATNGSQQTDYEPLSSRSFGFTMTFEPLLNPVSSTFTLDVSGIQASQFGASSLFLDGTDFSSILPTDQGIFGSNRITTPVASSITDDGSVTVSFQGGSLGVGDAIAFDYFELDLRCTP